MQRSRRSTTVLLALTALLALGLGACGDDDDDSTAASTTTTAGAGGADEEGAASIDVEMIDYAYKVSGPLQAGGTVKLSNTGKEFHMLGMGKLKPGKTLDDFREVLSQGGPEGGEASLSTTTTASADGGVNTSTTEAEGGVNTSTTAAEGSGGEGEERGDPTAEIVDEIGPPAGIMSPGQSAEITVPDLGAGTYVLACFIPTEGPEGVPHFAKGMLSELTVVEEKASEPTADATYIVAPGKAVEGPTTLKPGRHVLKIEAEGDAAELEPSLVLPDDGKTYQDIDAAFDTFDEALPEGAADKVPGKVIMGLFDLLETKTVYLTVELEEGTYQLVAEDSDADDPAVKEIITIKVE